MHLDETAEKPSVDEIAIIFGFLPPKEIMRARVCTTWRDAAKKALVPMTPFVVSVRSYNALRAMSTALPNLQQLSLDGDGTESPGATTTDVIEIFSNFTKLRKLTISCRMTFFCDFDDSRIGLSLEMFGRLPLLNELHCVGMKSLEGSLCDLLCLTDTLQKLRLKQCDNVRGSYMDLARFPQLKELDLYETAVTGDIRDIGEHDFPALERLSLPKTVHGGRRYEFQQVDDVPAFMHTIHHLLQRSSTMFKDYELLRAFDWQLSRDSPDWYDDDDDDDSVWYTPSPPLHFRFLSIGSRLGWSWCTVGRTHCCEINWLDPLPPNRSHGYESYIEKLQLGVWRVDFFRGYYNPPTEMEFRNLSAERDAAETFFSEWLHHAMDY